MHIFSIFYPMRWFLSKRHFTFSLLMLGFLSAAAQPTVKIQHYGARDGLSDDRVMSMIRDKDGFMWFGTWAGLNRYDGRNFVNYKSSPGDSSELENNRIDKIVEDQAGYLWIKAYDEQIYRFDKSTGRFLSISSIIGKRKTKIKFDEILPAEKGVIWISSVSDGIFCISNSDSARPFAINYPLKNSKGPVLGSKRINFLSVDRDSCVWIGTKQGVYFVKHTTGKLSGLKHLADAGGGDVLCSAENREFIWFGTGNGILIRLNKASKVCVSSKISPAAINKIHLAHSGGVVYATDQAGSIFSVGQDLIKPNWSYKTGMGSLRSIFEDSKGRLWLEPDLEGLILFDPEKRTVSRFTQQNTESYSRQPDDYFVFEDGEKRIWAAMKGAGFGYYKESSGTFEYFYNQPFGADHLFSNMVVSSHYDPSGLLWIGTSEGGVEKVTFTGNTFNQELRNRSAVINSNEIRSLYRDSKDRLWVANKGGELFLLKDGIRQPEPFTNMSPKQLGKIYSIREDHNGHMWFGTKSNGLFEGIPDNDNRARYKLTQYLADPNDPGSLSSNTIYSIFEDARQRLWIGSYGGGLNLLKREGNKVSFIHQFKNYPKQSFEKVRFVTDDRNGKIWVGTTEGLLILNPGAEIERSAISLFRKKPGDITSLGDNDIQFILRDRMNRMWVGTVAGGLNRCSLNNGKLQVKNFSVKQGLPSDYILSIAEDEWGNLWMATQKGLSKFDPKRAVFKNFDSEDGLPETSFSENTTAVLSTGQIFFGLKNGILSFEPRSINTLPRVAKMAFTNLQVNNKNVEVLGKDGILKRNINNIDQISLQYDQNTISIDYAVLDFKGVGKQRYAFRLLGFEPDWQDNHDLRRVTYTDLPPGEYILQVKSTNTDVYPLLPLRSLKIKISPPFYLTWWAYLFYFLIVVLISFYIFKLLATTLLLREKIAVEGKITALKMDFFTNVSHELRTPLTLIMSPIEEILQRESLSKEGSDHAKVIQKNAQRLNHFINQLLDLRKVQSGYGNLNVGAVDVESFLGSIIEYFLETLKTRNISVNINGLDNVGILWLDSAKMEVVFFNILSNAIKYAPANSTIFIDIDNKADSGMVGIIVRDSGPGVKDNEIERIFDLYYAGKGTDPNQQKSTGIGLSLSRSFVELHHGSIFAKNNEGGGLSVSVLLLKGNAHFSSVEFAKATDYQQKQTFVEDQNASVLSNTKVIGDHDVRFKTVLVVEDHDELREFIARSLEREYRVLTAINGDEGLKSANNLHPDIIISDVMMPVLDGIGMLRELKAEAETSHIPVILLSAKFSVQSQIEGIGFGADYYMPKPFSLALLRVAIKNILDRRSQMFNALQSGKKTLNLSPGEVVVTDQDEEFLKRTMQVVEKNIAEYDFDIDKLADEMAMSKSGFFKKFKSLTNLAPVEFVRQYRLKRAAQLIQAGEHNISGIAYAVGFNNPKYFSTCFREFYGHTPSAYIKSH